MLLEPALVAGIDLVAVPVALGNLGGAVVNLRYPAAALKDRRIGAKPHGAAEIAVETAGLEFVALHPLGHQTDHRFGVVPNSVEFASSMPQRLRAASMTAICIPKQIPKYGTWRSRANCTALIFPSVRYNSRASCR